MQPTAGWVTQEWMVKATIEAGFNVFSPRSGHERLDEVRQVAAWCKQYGIYYMPWMRGAKRLYFHVPAGLKEFSLRVAGSGGETVRLNVFAPDGRQVATGQTTQQGQIDVNVPVAGAADAVWSLELTRADTGVLEDSTIRLDPKLPPVLSLTPEEVFRQGKPGAK